MEAFRFRYPNGIESLESLREFVAEGVSFEIGSGFLKAGSRMPEKGSSVHPRREITLILEGELSTTSGNRTERLVAGDMVTIPAGQKQHTLVHKDTRLVWIFFGP